MLHSAEIRWFFDVDCFTRLRDAFVSNRLNMAAANADGHFLKQESERIDEYLVLKSPLHLGIKQRENQFQVKLLSCSPEKIIITDSVKGYGEEWLKLSLTDTEFAFSGLSSEIRSCCCRVKKQRLLRQYTLINGQPRSCGFGDTQGPDSGCSVELAKIAVLDCDDSLLSEASGIAFESFGGKLTGSHNRNAVASAFFSNFNAGYCFSYQNSMSYPIWLSSFNFAKYRQ